MDDHDLMRIRADTLFTYDAQGRMLLDNELDGRPAPRLFIAYTVDRYVVRFSHMVPDIIARRLTEIVESQPPTGTLHVSPAILGMLRETLEQCGPIMRQGGGPAYRFPESLLRSSQVVQVTAATLEVVRATYPWLLTELADWWPCFAVVREGAAVSVCFSSRIGADACEAGVDTLPSFRGRGYATAVTAAWGAAVREAGRIPLYSTSWDNSVSQGVAQRLGLIMFGADATLT